MKTEPKPKRPLWAKLLPALAGLVVFSLGLEVFFRAKYFSPLIQPHPCNPGWNHEQYLVMPDPESDYTLRPLFEGEEANRWGDFRVPVKVNVWGLRDREFFPDLCENCQRVLMLGDSFTFGEGLAWEETYAALTEKQLKEQGLKIQVFNGGVPAYSLRHSSQRLKKFLPFLRPHLVTLCWVPWTFPREKNDMVYLNGYLVYADQKDRIKVVGNNLFLSNHPPGSLAETLDLWLQEHSLAYFLAKFHRWWSALPFKLLFSHARPGAYTIPPVYFAEPMKTILEMAETSRQANARFLLIILQPSSKNAQMIKDFCAERHLPVITLAEDAFLPQSPYQQFIYPHDGHFNAEGAKYIAVHLVPQIRRLLTEPPPNTP